jgi:hypothetical protein
MTSRPRFVRTLLALSITSAAAIGCTEPEPPADTLNLDSGELVDPTPPLRLRVSGASVLDPNGDPLVLRGYNWGAWGLAQHGDAADNAAAGANHVRIPLRWWGEWRKGVDSRMKDAEGHINPDHLRFLDKTIRWATENHLWVTLFVDSNYGQGAPNQKHHDREDNFWTNERKRQEFVEVWRFLVERYRGWAYIGAYELLPEPRPPGITPEGVRAFYEALIPEIRALDPRTPIVIGPGDGYDLRLLDTAYTEVDSNVIYAGNYFIFGNPLSRMDDIDAFIAERNAPVWIDQVGIDANDDNEVALKSAEKVLEALNQRDVGWAWWQFRAGTENPNSHGIYYQDGNGGWELKEHFLAIVTDALDGVSDAP